MFDERLKGDNVFNYPLIVRQIEKRFYYYGNWSKITADHTKGSQSLEMWLPPETAQHIYIFSNVTERDYRLQENNF